MFKQAVFVKGPLFLLSLVWLVALLLILVGNCILFTLLFSNTREPLSYSQQGYLYSVALLRASSCPDVLPPSGEKKIVHRSGSASSGRSCQPPKAGCWNKGNVQAPGMPFGTSSVVSKDLVACGWGLPESLLKRKMHSGLARERNWGGRPRLSLGATMGWGPCSPHPTGAAQAPSSRSLGTKEGLGRLQGASWFFWFFLFFYFFIPWSLDFGGGFCFKGCQQTGAFLARWVFLPWGGQVGESLRLCSPV